MKGQNLFLEFNRQQLHNVKIFIIALFIFIKNNQSTLIFLAMVGK
jgi:hypothetical protein